MSLFHIQIDGLDAIFVHIPKTGGTSIRKNRQISNVRLFDPDPQWPKDVPHFTVLRNPFDRAESAWRDFRFLRPMTDLDFISFLTRFGMNAAEDQIINPRSIEHHVAPFTHSVHGLSYAATLLRTETLDSDWDDMCSGMHCRTIKLRRERKCPDNMERAPVTLESIELVKELYKDDYDFLEHVS